MKNILRFLLVAILFAASQSLRATDFQSGVIVYRTTSDSTVSVVSCGDIYLFNLTIPESVTYQESTYLVTTIAERAFSNLSMLENLEIPGSVTTIGAYACSGCPLETVTFGEGLISISENSFADCRNLLTLSFPNSLTSIDTRAFDSCTALESVTFGENLTTIGIYAFSGCTALQSVTFGENLTTIGSNAFTGCTALESVTFPNSLTSIDTRAFNGCTSLQSVTFPNSLTSIATGAFNGCSSLSSVVLPEGLTSIGSYAFNGCSNLTNVTLPNTLLSISSHLFENCISLSEVNIGTGVTKIEESAFYQCMALGSVTILDNVVTVGQKAFMGCINLGSVNIGNGVSSLGSNSFRDCSSLARLTLGNRISRIGNYAFKGCVALGKVVLPASLSSLENSSFSECYSLRSITCYAEIPPDCRTSEVFNGVPTDYCLLAVPSSSLPDYKEAPVWKDFSNIASIEEVIIANQSAYEATLAAIQDERAYLQQAVEKVESYLEEVPESIRGQIADINESLDAIQALAEAELMDVNTNGGLYGYSFDAEWIHQRINHVVYTGVLTAIQAERTYLEEELERHMADNQVANEDSVAAIRAILDQAESDANAELERVYWEPSSDYNYTFDAAAVHEMIANLLYTAGILEVSEDETSSEIRAIYTVDGRRCEQLQPGRVNIVVYADGHAEKVTVK